MKCMHCLVEFHADEIFSILDEDADGGWAISRYDCPKCKRMNLFLVNGTLIKSIGGWHFPIRGSAIPIRPKGISRPPIPEEVPSSISEDYHEACLVLYDSPKASAALSRRCLQYVLRDAAKVRPGNLADEIQQVLDSGRLPSHLASAIDAIRNIGNFAAHPTKSEATGEIIQVEPGEAEWNLDVLELLFDFYYVQPQAVARKKEALNKKLEEAGKNPMK